jgi:hypothetical protein
MSSRVLCPACNGGRTSERSCVVYDRLGVTFYHCYRASCPTPNGVYNGVSSQPDAPKVMQLPNREPLSDARRKWLCSKFALEDGDVARLRPLWTGERYWFPIYNQHGIENGGTARSYTKLPKTLTYGDGWALGSWYLAPDYGEIWLVEDQISAAKVARFRTCVALIGVSVHRALMDVLVHLQRPCVLALDGDALEKAVSTSYRMQSLGIETRVVYLEQDVKHPDVDVRSLVCTR